MKGVVFTEFLEMVEEKYGYSVVDHIIEESQLKSNGVYTAIGTYDHSEMVQLLSNLSEKVNQPIPVLLQEYGKYIFEYFLKNYGGFFEPFDNAFDFLDSIENHIHIEVKKLYPDAELPKFTTSRPDEKTMIMDYSSTRKMSDLAQGLIEKSLSYYKEHAIVHKENLNEDGTSVRFRIIKQ